MRREALRSIDFRDTPVGPDENLALRQIEIEGAAFIAGFGQRRIGGPQGFQYRLEQRPGLVVGTPVDRRLRLLIGELGGRAHETAHEAVRPFLAVGVEHHAHGETGPRLFLAQRAEVVGNLFRQHGNDAIRKIDRVAALQGLAIERASRAHIVRDIGNRDPGDEATLVPGIIIGLCVNRIVVIAGIDWVDGEEGHLRQVLAALAVKRWQRLGLLHDARREHIRDAMRVHRDQRDLSLVSRAAEAFDHARDRQAAASAPRNVETHELAILGLACIARLDPPFAQLLAIDGQDRAAAIALAINAKQARLLAREFLDRSREIAIALVLAQRLDPAEQPVAGASRPDPLVARAVVGDQHFRRRALGLLPVDGKAIEFAVAVMARDLDDSNRR